MNRDALARKLGFTRQDIDLLLTMFEKNARKSLHEMEEAVKRNDMEAISYAAHSIKGIAGNLKIDAVFVLAQKVDTAAKAGRDENYALMHHQLSEEIDAALQDGTI